MATYICVCMVICVSVTRYFTSFLLKAFCNLFISVKKQATHIAVSCGCYAVSLLFFLFYAHLPIVDMYWYDVCSFEAYSKM